MNFSDYVNVSKKYKYLLNGGRIMNKRKRMLIDNKFQVKTLIYITGTIFVAMIICISFLGINIYLNNQKLKKIVNNQEDVFITNTDIYKSLLLFSHDAQPLKLQDIKKIYSRDLNMNSVKMNQNVMEINEIMGNNNLQLYVTGLLFIILITSIFLITKYKTDNILGPAYIINKHMNDVINNKDPELRSLRKNDELKEFYSVFCKMLSKLKENEV